MSNDAYNRIGATAYTYDQNGNTLTAGSNGYTWDYRNRMTTSGTGLATSTYTYDHTTERMTKTTNGITTVYPNDAYNRGGSTTTIHITDPSGIELATIEGNGLSTTTVYSHQDHLGSTNVLTTNTGTLKEVGDYYPYGAPRVQTTYAGTREQRGYLSEDYDTDSSLSYLNARYYAGDRGQFLSQDPVFWEVGQTSDGNAVLRNPQAQNSYSYAQNSPIIQKDPDGRCGTICVVLFGLFTPNVAYSPDIGEEDYTSPVETTIAVGSLLPIGRNYGKLGEVSEQVVTKVTGYTDHGLTRKIARGVPTSDVVNTVRNPDVVLKQSGGTFLHITDGGNGVSHRL